MLFSTLAVGPPRLLRVYEVRAVTLRGAAAVAVCLSTLPNLSSRGQFDIACLPLHETRVPGHKDL